MKKNEKWSLYIQSKMLHSDAATYREFSEGIGVGYATVYHWINNSRSPSFANLCKVKACYPNDDLDWIFED